jgi:glycosyltransferase involved in cell wall biosynthesis
MRIGFDLRPFLREETGVGVYLKSLLAELARIDGRDEFILFSASWKDRFPAAKVPAFAQGRLIDKKWPVKAVNLLWRNLGWPRLDGLAGARLDLTHSATPLPLPTRGRTVVTVCDLFFLEDPARADREARRAFLSRTAGALRRADGVLTISEFSRRGIRERFDLAEEKVLVTRLGLSPAFAAAADPERELALRRELDLAGPFLLFVGASEPRKNLPRLIEAMRILRDRGRRVPLVLAGRPGGDEDRVIAAIAAAGLEPLVRRAGYRSDEDIRALYGAAAALVFPSLAEGFGLPLLEAMACGLPAAVSGVSALPEVGGDAALYFDPADASAMAAAIASLLDDEDLRRRLRAKGLQRARLFDWSETARLTLDFYRRIAGTA